jgi:signal transduction histidine kinase
MYYTYVQVICIPSLLRVSTIGQSASSDVYIYDSTDSSGEVKFLGGVRVTVKGNEGEEVTLTYLPEVELDVLEKENKLFFSENVTVASKVWTAAIVGDKSTYKMESVFVILCAFITLVASISIGIWVVTNSRRVAKFNEIQAASEAERAALVLKSAREATKAERELNDFIGHEVRNPVAAAMAACSFIKAEVNKDSPLQDEESRDSTRNDVDIIDKSLNFVNDLLRNMLGKNWSCLFPTVRIDNII